MGRRKKVAWLIGRAKANESVEKSPCSRMGHTRRRPHPHPDPKQSIKLWIDPHANQPASPPRIPHLGKFRWLFATRSAALVGKLDLIPWTCS